VYASGREIVKIDYHNVTAYRSELKRIQFIDKNQYCVERAFFASKMPPEVLLCSIIVVHSQVCVYERERVRNKNKCMGRLAIVE
jgi:hypothetical protein